MRPTAFDVFFSRTAQIIALLFLVVGFILPSEGVGVTICWFKRFASLPCPGCGLTRSVSSILHWQWAKSWGYHPLGAVFVGTMLLLVFNLVMPQRVVRFVRRFFDRQYDALEVWLIAFAAVFIAFGLIRLGVYLVTGIAY